MLQQTRIDEYVSKLVQMEGSDLHLKVGAPPAVRVHGRLAYLEGEEVLRPQDTEKVLGEIIPEKLAREFEDDGEADFSYAVVGVGRFRVSAFRQRGSVSIVMRFIPFGVPKFEDLGLPEVIGRLAREERGIILVTGTTGSGKSTTLASMLDLVNQREVGADTASYSRALKRVLRQDPDIILIGEIRDSESAQMALSGAETGHLVLSTLHTLDATETINRMIDLFPPHERGQVRAMLVGTLKGIVGQRLIRTKDGAGRVAACEIMVSTGRTKDFIMDPDQTGQIQSAIAEGEYYGMQTFDQALLKLIEEDRVTYEEALQVASRPQDFKLMVQATGMSMSR